MKLLLLLLLALPVHIEAEVSDYPIYPVTEHAVYDGDTTHFYNLQVGFEITIKKVSVRIIGVDTPEVRGSEKVAGLVVKARVEEWIGQHKINVINMGKGKYYGRFVGDIIRSDGERLSEFLLKSKLAKPYDGGTKEEWTDEELQAIITSE